MAKAKKKAAGGDDAANSGGAKYPRQAVDKALRIPKAILTQGAGHACTPEEAAGFCKVKLTGPVRVEISSAIKYGFLSRGDDGKLALTERATSILRPKHDGDAKVGLRAAVLDAPQIGSVYLHYRGENIPEETFFRNTVVDTYKVPSAKFDEFRTVFLESLQAADLLEKHGESVRVVDVSDQSVPVGEKSELTKKLGRGVAVSATDTCFVMQPFAAPLGDYYEKIYKPAIEKAGLTPLRADADLFGTGKIMEQVWRGITAARVLVAELTSRNPNVFYELGLAHAQNKPVVLISATEADVPFDLTHIRVIYYNKDDPFWGQKLMDKVTENILSALRNPEEAIFKAT